VGHRYTLKSQAASGEIAHRIRGYQKKNKGGQEVGGVCQVGTTYQETADNRPGGSAKQGCGGGALKGRSNGGGGSCLAKDGKGLSIL